MKTQMKHYMSEEKVPILRLHLLDKEPISKLCDELALQPTVFYRVSRRIHDRSEVGGAKTAANPSAEGRVNNGQPNLRAVQIRG
jgi:hypothetical protein